MDEPPALMTGVQIVGTAATIEEVLALARSADLEAAILDINIAGQLTYPVADILRSRGIPVIFATGYGSAALPERFRGLPTLHKPFDTRRFEEVVHTASLPLLIAAQERPIGLELSSTAY